jgi:hypothetical protein
MVLLVWPPAEHLWIGRNRAANSRLTMPLDGHFGAQRLLKIPAARGPSGISPAAQLKRE